MIQLTTTDKTNVFISPDYITGISEKDGVTRIYTSGWRYYEVTEPPKEVARKVLEYKMNMAKSSAAYMLSMQDEERLAASQEFNWVERDLHKLAGLGEDHE